ncbi:MAG TPA: response regulator [Arenimonas sp.]|nr:response regulator [Arenimonas sp.]
MDRRILLLEDNTISREFLHEALLCFSMPVDVADTLAKACSMARKNRYALLLCDVHLSDGGPRTVFSALQSLQENSLIVAITADASPEGKEFLLDIGYREVWWKPIPMIELQNQVARILDIGIATDSNDSPFLQWDEAAALRAVGNNQATLDALRVLFLSELPRQVKTIEQAFKTANHAELKAECHKLLAGCGFVGASRLGNSVRELCGKPDKPEKMDAFAQEARKCLELP